MTQEGDILHIISLLIPFNLAKVGTLSRATKFVLGGNLRYSFSAHWLTALDQSQLITGKGLSGPPSM